MARSGHIAQIRAAIGSQLLLMPSVSNAVFDAAGRLLLLRHLHSGTWGTPGGAMEPGESPAEAAARELYEETGLRCEPFALIGVSGGPNHTVRYPNGDLTAYVTIVFAVTWDQTDIRPDGIEVDGARWVTAAEARDTEMDPLTREVVDMIFAWSGAPPSRRSARFVPVAPTR